ncbi:DsbC family protein [Piscinibacter sp.]|uniref:DsbC family protein n=1 Tax=Piscinibacter sp. TaxID=1903157 RepID=UPI002BC43F2B|nr:DsbC family protein [Albitalea sp.]HUG25399.1 DsbC family protein [Albitalea sp.]
MKRLLISCAMALAAAANAAPADEGAVRATLQRVFPQGTVQGIAKTPVPGLLEAVIDGRIFYVTDDGRHILGGPLVDVAGNRNLTQARLDEINAIPFDSLPLDWAFKRVKGSGARKLAIFEDPDCPYCKRLEEALKVVDNVTVYVFLYPIDEIHPEAAEKSRGVWCAKDRLKAWDDVMRTGVAPSSGTDCDNPIDKIVRYAKQQRISGTPTTVLADGRRLVGAVSSAELEKQLLMAAQARAASSPGKN